ncbi:MULTISPECIES: hypothetical protein [unclassified Rhodococcus (in: high G+C Gram-positive bacteria)]|uniref:hypothetical protein n=1 Tax=unclassified Rhodococcus (in: high G+C Gram-positive bacteria) TaxID=192944 RepID=UPI00117AE91E|nr:MULTISPECIES: hypothetical protein [unclassified Rhodococcus (in: high G+C Gram-positive bacteria)]
MGAVLNRQIAADGVIAYQDSDQTDLFHYLPARIDAVNKETLLNFSVEYFGINEKPYYRAMSGDANVQSVVGGVLAGRATPDITRDQRDAISDAISQQYSVDKFRLVPLEVREVKVQPVFAKAFAQMGEGSSSEFPSTVKFGSTFNYVIASGNSLFAEMAGASIAGSGDDPSTPQVGANITGVADFYGDPWEASIECDLSQVWEYTRDTVSSGLNLGWFKFGTEYDKIAQKLIRENVIKIRYREGSGGDQFGRQLLETTKTVFEAINKQVTSGEGLFRFEPNPDPQVLPEQKDTWGSSLLPWQASVNLGFAKNSFQQSISYKQDVSFTGKIAVPVASSMNLALSCGRDTQQYFTDLQLQKTGCIDTKKSAGLQRRLGAEKAAKNAKLLELYDNLVAGKITIQQYGTLKDLLNTMTLTDGKSKQLSDVSDRISAVIAAVAGSK